MKYAGIGSREISLGVKSDIRMLARNLAQKGWHLRSGGAVGSDKSFADETPPGQRTLYLPWPEYNDLSGPDCRVLTPQERRDCVQVAQQLHPAWQRCSPGARSLHARNVAIILGPSLGDPVNFVVCYTDEGKLVGGTAMGIRIARKFGIPVLNLGSLKRSEIEQEMFADERKMA